jgi:hypothetical protein
MFHLSDAAAQRLGLHPAPVGKRSKIPKPDWRPGFLVQLAALGVFNEFGEPRIEHRFHPTRNWAFDVAWPAPLQLAVEIEGGVWLHQTGSPRWSHGMGANAERDARKFAEAMLLGWWILRVTPRLVASGDAALYTAQILARIRTGDWLPSHRLLSATARRRRRARGPHHG